MNVIRYGEKKTAYELSEKLDGRIEIRVCHANQKERAKIKAHRTTPHCFVAYARFSGTNPRAKYWLAQIVKAYPSHFANDRVDFVMR